MSQLTRVMKDPSLTLLVCVTLFGLGFAQGAELEQADPFNRNRFSLSFDAGFNVRAEFRNMAPNVAPPPATAAV